MNIGNVQEYKLNIDNKEYTFRMDFQCICKFEDKYNNSLEIVNNYLQGNKQYSNLIKILSCSCVEKDLEEEELKKEISFDLPTLKVLDSIGYAMLVGSLKLDKKDNKKESKAKKNQRTSRQSL